jgi:glycosyltransferase involved in cell wall biosynthesis
VPRSHHHTLIVLPALDEEESVGGVVREIFAVVPDVTVLVVDDGSSDATAERALEAGGLVARLPFTLGVGGAMRTGFRYAIENGFDTVVQVDADGQHDPAGLPTLFDALQDGHDGRVDLVLGARFAGAGDYRMTGPRRWATVLLAGILSRAARTRLTDTTSGFRASGPRAVALFAEQYPAEYLGDTIEALVIALRSGLVVRQVPVAMRARASGTPTHGPLRSTAFLGRAMVALCFAFLRPTSRNGAAS